MYGETHQAHERRCRVVSFAERPRRALDLLFYGNSHAELPQYTTDLRTTGEGYGLEIKSRHYAVRLSHQMGQLDRLISTREHGVELYAGGHRHGEPPNADWGNDYVDKDNFQKLRIRNWPHCPNYETVPQGRCACGSGVGAFLIVQSIRY